MVCAYSISDGIMFGILSYVLLKTLSGHFREVSKTSWVLVGLFVLKIVFNALSA
jgi:AGZA family xanthine/uracil permease-like MFS transporter